MVLRNIVLEHLALVIKGMATMVFQACIRLRITTILFTKVDFRHLKNSMVTQTCQICLTGCQCLTPVTLNSLVIPDIPDLKDILGTVRWCIQWIRGVTHHLHSCLLTTHKDLSKCLTILQQRKVAHTVFQASLAKEAILLKKRPPSNLTLQSIFKDFPLSQSNQTSFTTLPTVDRKYSLKLLKNKSPILRIYLRKQVKSKITLRKKVVT